MYQKIAAHPTVCEIFAKTFVGRGLVIDEQVAAMNTEFLAELQKVLDGLKPEVDFVEPIPLALLSGVAVKVKTAVLLAQLVDLNASLLALPDNFTVHKKLVRGRERCAQVFAQLAERTVDWVVAEDLAYASILSDGVSIRLTGEDV